MQNDQGRERLLRRWHLSRDLEEVREWRGEGNIPCRGKSMGRGSEAAVCLSKARVARAKGKG